MVLGEVGHQAAGFHVLALVHHHGQTMLECKLSRALHEGRTLAAEPNPACAPFRGIVKRCRQFVRAFQLVVGKSTPITRVCG
jgi:hypothetical protein